MSRMSARFVGQKVGMSTEWVYSMWEKMGLVFKDSIGNWDLTSLGAEIGGRLSNGRVPVPTFDFEKIEKMMIDFYNKTHQ